MFVKITQRRADDTICSVIASYYHYRQGTDRECLAKKYSTIPAAAIKATCKNIRVMGDGNKA